MRIDTKQSEIEDEEIGRRMKDGSEKKRVRIVSDLGFLGLKSQFAQFGD